MQIYLASVMAKKEMVKNGVGHVPFSFHSYPNTPKNVLGLTMFTRVQRDPENPDRWIYEATHLSISHEWTEVSPEEEVRNTLLHEIAHVKAGYEASHGEEWAKECRKLGINPDEFANPDKKPHFFDDDFILE